MKATDVYVHPSAEVHPSAVIGKGSKIWNGAQVREGAVLGEGCNLGKDVYIDVGVTLGQRVRIQNTVSVFHGVSLADDVFVGPHVCFTNDLYPRAFNKDWKVIPTIVEAGASIGAGATVLCGVTIGSYALVGVASVVTNDVPAYGLVTGNPATLKKYVCRCGMPLVDAKARTSDRYVCASCGHKVALPPPKT